MFHGKYVINSHNHPCNMGTRNLIFREYDSYLGLKTFIVHGFGVQRYGIHLVDIYGKLVGKYTKQLHGSGWDLLIHCYHLLNHQSSIFCTYQDLSLPSQLDSSTLQLYTIQTTSRITKHHHQSTILTKKNLFTPRSNPEHLTNV